MEHIETKCPVCHEKYSDPKILPCAHLLCRDCLVSWIKTSTEAHCPLCRSDIYYPKDNNSRSSEDMADSLPTDHAMSAIVESCSILSKRQICFLHINTDAVSLCLACSVMMCQSCVEYHHALPLTSSHKTENLATLTSERLAALRQTPCSTHPNETAKLVCSTHSVPICHLCASSKHRACQEVRDLNEILEKHKQSFAEMADDLTKAESDLNETLEKFEEMVVTTEKDTKAAYTKIDSMCDDFIISVETCRNKLKKILKESEEILQAAIEERKSYLAQRIGLVTSHRLLLKRVQQTASASVQFAMVNVIQNRVKDLSSVVSLPSDMKPMNIAKLNIDEEIPLRVTRELENISQMTIISPIRDLIHSGVQNIWMFHNTCGKNIVLDRNRQTAEVKNSSVLDDRLVMSSEPMSTNILYEVLVVDVDTRYKGDYTVIGFCQEDPISNILPSDYRGMKNFVGVYSVSYIRHGQWNKVYPCPALKTVKAGSRIGVMADTSHSLRMYVDGKDQGVVAENVVQPCYAVFDLRYFLKKILVEETDTRFSGEFVVIVVCEENPLSVTLPTVYCEMKTLVGVYVTGGTRHGQRNTWMFHNKCGSNIVLSSNGQTAEVKNSNVSCNRVLISREPMSTNKLYEILVNKTDTRYFGKYIRIGVCEKNPLSIKLLAYCSHIESFVGVHEKGRIHQCEWTDEYACPALSTVKAGSRLGVMVDTSHSLHVYVDSKDQGVMAKNVARPCYAMFDLCFFLNKCKH